MTPCIKMDFCIVEYNVISILSTTHFYYHVQMLSHNRGAAAVKRIKPWLAWLWTEFLRVKKDQHCRQI